MDFTIIITASAIPSHPKILLIKEVIESLNKLDFSNYKLKKKIKVILSHDGTNKINNEYLNKLYENYSKYLDNLKDYVNSYNKNSKIFELKIIVSDKYGHLTGNIRNCMKYIDTEYILILQHDFRLIKKINPLSIFEDMKNNPKLKQIVLNDNKNLPIDWSKDEFNFFGNHNIVTKNNAYCSTLSWFDKNHFSTKKYYTDIVLKICKDGHFMEKTLHKLNNSVETHLKFGTYFYGEVNDGEYIEHSYGRFAGKYIDPNVSIPKERHELIKYATNRLNNL